LLSSVGDPDAYAIAEFGIGCNDGARISGITLEDEKVLGTCHIALGSNVHFGGALDTSIHVDGVIKNPTIWLDGELVVDAGVMRADLADV
jgi:leucyl aminopeptidase (aminopeptidase T)